MDNAVLNAIANRRSVRAYTGAALTKEQLDALALAAVQSPSARNSQPWRIVVVDDAATLKEMETDALAHVNNIGDEQMKAMVNARGCVLFYGAPAVLFIAIEGTEWAKLDCGITAQTVALAAQGLGLGSVIVGMGRFLFEGYGDKWPKRLGFPDGFGFGLCVAVGHAADDGKPHEADLGKISRA